MLPAEDARNRVVSPLLGGTFWPGSRGLLESVGRHLRKLAPAAQAVVAFEVDDYDPEGTWGWSVLVRAAGTEITEPDELEAVKALGLRVWAFKRRGEVAAGHEDASPWRRPNAKYASGPKKLA